MNTLSIFREFGSKLRELRHASGGNVVVIFALSIIPVMGGVGAAVDYSQANSIKAAMQQAADSASLGTIKTAASLSASAVQSTAQGLFTSSFNRPSVSPIVSATYDSATNVVTVNATTTHPTNFMKMLGVANMGVSVKSKARMGSRTWQVCVIVTDPDSNHTLLAKNNSKINFTNCMVQVNTQNWDAVESRDTSYIHSTNGENCYVGDIHYGDVKPPKNLTCTFFPDPFASYNVPTNTCAYTNKTVTTSTTLSPGTYCGGINISANVTFSPGVYYIQDGDLTITGSANVTATDVTFLISGANSNLNITTTGTLTLSPNTNAGQWSGFVFYYDQPSSTNNKKSKGGHNYIKNATINMSGVMYLVGQELNIMNGAKITVNPGSIIAGFILPDNDATLNLTGSLNSALSILNQLKKTGESSGTVVLVQ